MNNGPRFHAILKSIAWCGPFDLGHPIESEYWFWTFNKKITFLTFKLFLMYLNREPRCMKSNFTNFSITTTEQMSLSLEGFFLANWQFIIILFNSNASHVSYLQSACGINFWLQVNENKETTNKHRLTSVILAIVSFNNKKKWTPFMGDWFYCEGYSFSILILLLAKKPFF